MTEDCADGAERDDAHDDQWLDIAFQGNGEQRVDDHQRQQRALQQTVHGLGELSLFAGHADGQPWVLGFEIGHHLGVDTAQHFFGLDGGTIDICDDVHDASTVGSANGRIAAAQFEFGDAEEGHLFAVRCANVHVFKIADRRAL